MFDRCARPCAVSFEQQMRMIMPQSNLSPEQYAGFQRDGFLVVRGLFKPLEITEIRETFMEMGKDGPVAGLSDVPKPKHGASIDSKRTGDPLAFYPRMMHPHTHTDKP